MKRITYKIISIAIICIFMMNCSYADEIINEVNSNTVIEELDNTVKVEEVNATENDLKNTYVWQDVKRADKGYSNYKDIVNGDPHFGWLLGKFEISGFSRKLKDEDENWIFLKNVGDEIKLNFKLQQDLEKLNDNEKLKIASDENGFDNEFGVKETNFGQGCLIIRKIDSNGNKNEPKLYTNYLKGVAVEANTEFDPFEEGDYEVKLDYKVVKNNGLIFKNANNYCMRFTFKIRNGNSMVFPIDVVTNNELMNTSITENGFYLNLAESKYLDITVKKEVLKEGSEGLIEDTRFNRPAKDGEKYTDEGIYTITVINHYTNETTTKKIYVGKDKILKAHMQTGRSIDKIKELVNSGATIDEEGNISNIPKKFKTNLEEQELSVDNGRNIQVVPICIAVLIIVFVIIMFIKSKKEKKYLDKKYKSKIENEYNKYYKINDTFLLHVYIENKAYKYDLYNEKNDVISTKIIKDTDIENMDELKNKVLNDININATIDKIEEIGKEEFEKNK